MCGVGVIQHDGLPSGYWQRQLMEETQMLFHFLGAGGAISSTRVPHGVMNATSFFQEIMV